MIAKELARNLDQNQQNVTIVMAKVKLDPTKVFSQSSKHVLNVMGMEKQLVKHVQNVKVMEKFKATRMFQLKFQEVLMMELV